MVSLYVSIYKSKLAVMRLVDSLGNSIGSNFDNGSKLTAYIAEQCFSINTSFINNTVNIIFLIKL